MLEPKIDLRIARLRRDLASTLGLVLPLFEVIAGMGYYRIYH